MEPSDLLKDLISIPSVNPMGRELDGPEMGEKRLSDFLVRFFSERSIECERITVDERRDNVIARVRGDDRLPTVLFDAHMDTVPVDRMTIDPYLPTIVGGRIYGRGACDVKGGMAAMISAMSRFAHDRQQERPTLIMACTCDEELNQLGVQHLIDGISNRSQSYRLLPKPPDMIVVAEPTELNVAVAHLGSVRWMIRTRGKAAHSSDPRQGENAIYRMAKLITQLESHANDLSNSAAHPLCGRKALSIGIIEGGESVNIIPAECSISIDRRLLPGEDGLTVVSEVDAYLRERTDIQFETVPPSTVGYALPDDNNRELADRIVAAGSGIQHCSIVGLPFGTHAARYSRSGIPSVVFGPGSIQQAHTVDEWLAIEQLEHAAETLYRFLSGFSLAE